MSILQSSWVPGLESVFRDCGCRGKGRGQHRSGCALRGIDQYLGWLLGVEGAEAYAVACALTLDERVSVLEDAAEWPQTWMITKVLAQALKLPEYRVYGRVCNMSADERNEVLKLTLGGHDGG